MKTPCFIIEKEKLDANYAYLSSSIAKAWPNFRIGISYKTNALPWIVRHFQSLGCCAEVVSDDEYMLALSTGIPKDRIIYNGVAKDRETFLDAIRNHAVVNIDSEYEIDWLDDLGEGDWEVGIRVNFDLESRCPGQTQCGEEGERFGFCYENGELIRNIGRIREKGVHVAGLHLHKSSKTRMPDIYRAIAEAAVSVAEEYDLQLRYVDIGGGFFGGLDTKPQYPAYFDMMVEILRRRFDPGTTMLIAEPGMALVGAFVSYVTTVVDVKRTLSGVFAVTDGSRIHIDPLMTKSGYSCDTERPGTAERRMVEKQTVCGFTCMEHDRLFTMRNEPELLPGDTITYHRVGAYTMCLSPLFIKWFPEVWVDSDGALHRVRTRWDTDAYRFGSTGDDVT